VWVSAEGQVARRVQGIAYSLIREFIIEWAGVHHFDDELPEIV